jgi:putative membrane protein
MTIATMTLLAALSAPGVSLAQSATQGSQGASGTAATTSSQGAGNSDSAATAGQRRVDRADRDFMEKAAHSGFAEVESSRLAMEKATSPEIRAFAEQMVKDHTQTNQELAALAQARGVKLPDGPSMVQKGKMKLLSTADGADFDRRYAESMGIEAHRDTIELFEKASRNAKDAEIKAFAAGKLPALRHHLEMAQQLPQAKENNRK